MGDDDASNSLYSRPCRHDAAGGTCLDLRAEQRQRSGKRLDRLERRVKDQPSQSTGTPGHPVNPSTSKEVEVHDEQQARNQPPLATGKDLKGPSTKLPPSKTPE